MYQQWLYNRVSTKTVNTRTNERIELDMMKSLNLFFFSVVMMMLFSVSAYASEPRVIGTYSDWTAYEFTEDGSKVCYMASQPKKSEGNYTRRGEIFALVTHRPAENTKNVFSYIAGYSYKPGSDVNVAVAGNKFVLFTQDETAWAPDAQIDTQIADSIKRGSNMVVKGQSSRGTATTDTFSLRGSSAAYQAISQECGM